MEIDRLVQSNNELANSVDNAITLAERLEDGRIRAMNQSEKLMWKTTLGLMILMALMMLTCVCITYCTTKSMNNFVDKVYDYEYPSISNEMEQTQEITIGDEK